MKRFLTCHQATIVVAFLMLAMLGLVPVTAAVGDAFAVGKDSNGLDLFRVKTTGAVVFNGPVISKRTATATNANLSTSSSLVAVTNTSVARGIYLPDAGKCDTGHTITVKDESGAAGSIAIGIYGAGSDTIDGAAVKAISTNYGSVTVYKGDSGKWYTR